MLDLLVAMGYGGAEGKTTRTQLSNDRGNDGIIDQDAPGLARICGQAKRYAPESSIDRPTVQGFVGALAGNSASQDAFIRTARYTQGARTFAESVAARVVLIGADRLARLMIKYGVGVQVKQTHDVVEIDKDFFVGRRRSCRWVVRRLSAVAEGAAGRATRTVSPGEDDPHVHDDLQDRHMGPVPLRV